MTLEEAFECISNHIASLEARETELRGSISDLKDQENHAIEAKHTAWEEMEVAEAAHTKQLKTISAGLDALVGQKVALEAEIKSLVEKKGLLQVESADLIKKNIEFREYETKVLKSLKARESSVSERERIVRERELLADNKALLG